jgi:hypothetical protein
MGDLVEERGSGRSTLWFWKETLAAIADSVARDLWEHKLLAFRAIGIGWVLLLRTDPVTNYFVRALPWTRAHPLTVALPIAFFVWPAVAGWLVARTHRSQRAAMVLAFTASIPSVFLPGMWLMTTHFATRKHRLAELLGILFLVMVGTLIGGFFQANRPSNTDSFTGRRGLGASRT